MDWAWLVMASVESTLLPERISGKKVETKLERQNSRKVFRAYELSGAFINLMSFWKLHKALMATNHSNLKWKAPQALKSFHGSNHNKLWPPLKSETSSGKQTLRKWSA
jgi:hypothetical protein